MNNCCDSYGMCVQGKNCPARDCSQAKGRDNVAAWMATPKQLEALMNDAYKPSDYQFGFLELAKTLLFCFFVAVGFIGLTMAGYALFNLNYPSTTCTALQVVGFCK